MKVAIDASHVAKIKFTAEFTCTPAEDIKGYQRKNINKLQNKN